MKIILAIVLSSFGLAHAQFAPLPTQGSSSCVSKVSQVQTQEGSSEKTIQMSNSDSITDLSFVVQDLTLSIKSYRAIGPYTRCPQNKEISRKIDKQIIVKVRVSLKLDPASQIDPKLKFPYFKVKSNSTEIEHDLQGKSAYSVESESELKFLGMEIDQDTGYPIENYEYDIIALLIPLK